MKILLNFLPLKSGGGVQVALDFIGQAKRLGSAHQWYMVATKGTPLAETEPSNNFKIVRVVDNRLAARLWFENVGCRQVVREVRPDVVYTQFGPHWPAVRGPHVVGCAYPILVYPDMDFWREYTARELFEYKIKNWRRASLLRSADEVIFETPVMRDRMVRHHRLDRSRLHVVKPAVSALVKPGHCHSETASRCSHLPQRFRVLLISGFQKHKNISLLPKIAAALKRNGAPPDISFITTLPARHEGTKRLAAEARALDVESMMYNFGPVPEVGCAELYRAVDAVILPSAIESFSNTIAEAWSMRKPLLISDLDWARSACGDGAIYFDYNDPDDAASKIVALRRDPAAVANLIDAGTAMLGTYATSEQRFLEYLSIIEARYRRETGEETVAIASEVAGVQPAP